MYKRQNLNWFLTNDYKIKKREVGDEDYEYQVQFSDVYKRQLHDRPNVSKPARDKVEKALKEMNYQPNVYWK